MVKTLKFKTILRIVCIHRITIRSLQDGKSVPNFHFRNISEWNLTSSWKKDIHVAFRLKRNSGSNDRQKKGFLHSPCFFGRSTVNLCSTSRVFPDNVPNKAPLPSITMKPNLLSSASSAVRAWNVHRNNFLTRHAELIRRINWKYIHIFSTLTDWDDTVFYVNFLWHLSECPFWEYSEKYR